MPSNNQFCIQVALAIPFVDALTYLVPEVINHSKLMIGARVVVPFRNKEMVAIVIDTQAGEYSKKLRNIIRVLDKEAFIPEQNIKFLYQVHHYYLQPLGEVILNSIPKWF